MSKKCDSCKREIENGEECWEVHGLLYHIDDECLGDVAMSLLRNIRTVVRA